MSSKNDKKPANNSAGQDNKNKTTPPPASQQKPDTSKPADNKAAQAGKNTDKAGNNNQQSGKQPANNQPMTTAKPLNGNADKAGAAPGKANTGTAPAGNKPAPATGNKNGSTPPPPSKPAEHKQSPLPLVISILALALGGYALFNSMRDDQPDHSSEVQSLQSQVAELQKALAGKADSSNIKTLEQSVQKLDKEISSLPAPVENAAPDEAEIKKLIASQVEQAKQSLQQQLPAADAPKGLSKEQVSTMIKDALASAGSSEAAPAIDFSSEIDTIKQDKAAIEQYMNSIKQEGEQIKASLAESLANAEQKITAADDRPVVYPLINTLKLAEISSNSGQYSVASQYLEQAKNSFAALNLEQPPYAEFAGQIDKLAQQTAQLAEQQNSQKQIDGVIASINDWPFINTNPENLLNSKGSEQPTENWKDDLKNIGSNLLSNTVTITKNDAAGLTWINENPHLQQIIRENVRLDLAMIRNALLIGDKDRAQQIAATLEEQVKHYFNTDADVVKQALQTVNGLTGEQSDAPDIASLIQSIQKAG